jgi:hypothetical protein
MGRKSLTGFDCIIEGLDRRKAEMVFEVPADFSRRFTPG